MRQFIYVVIQPHPSILCKLLIKINLQKRHEVHADYVTIVQRLNTHPVRQRGKNDFRLSVASWI